MRTDEDPAFRARPPAQAPGARGVAFSTILSLFLLLFTLSQAFGGQGTAGPRRIDAKRGGPPVAARGEVRVGETVTYVFEARAGERFDGRIRRHTGSAGFDVTGPDGEALPEEEFDFNQSLQGGLVKTGLYKINVTTLEGPPSRYTLTVRRY